MYQTSAKTGENVETAFLEVVTKALKSMKPLIQTNQQSTSASMNLNLESNNQSGGCC